MASRTLDPHASVSGHLWLYEGKRRSTWCAKWRDHQGQHEKRLGPASTGKGSPPPGFLREREANVLLDEILVDARRGQLLQQRTGLTLKDIAEEWYERGRFERDWSASTQIDYRSVLDAHLLPRFGAQRIEAITTEEIERWRDDLATDSKRSRRTVNKIVTLLHGVYEYALDRHQLNVNPVAKVKRLRESNEAARFDFYSPEEITTLVAAATKGAHRNPGSRQSTKEPERSLRAAEDRQDAAIFLTAALSGLRRGELLALRWEDVDFEQSSIRVYEGFSANKLGKTESRKSRVVPMVDKITEALRELKRRAAYAGKQDLVYVGRDGTHLDGSALRRRYLATVEAAGLRRLRFHDLRHTFGSLSINVASIVQVQAWMGHANISTTMRYLHHKSRADDAQTLSVAFRPKKKRKPASKRSTAAEKRSPRERAAV
ncbi:MAG: tyrosine-type recombinase/integrase [Solirubrobacteraceae bacterium]